MRVQLGDQLRPRRDAAAQQELDNLPLRQAVAALNPKLRAVVVLRFFAGYTLEETARCLGLPRGTVATRQRRALELLRLELDDSSGEEG